MNSQYRFQCVCGAFAKKSNLCRHGCANGICCRCTECAKNLIGFSIYYNIKKTIRVKKVVSREDIFIAKLKKLLSQPDGDYIVKKNTNYEDYETDADILVFAEFNCNIYCRRTRSWVPSRKCHLHYGCHISTEFYELCNRYGYTFEWENCCMAGLYKK